MVELVLDELVLETELIRKRNLVDVETNHTSMDPCLEMTRRLKALAARFTDAAGNALSVVDPYFHRLSGNVVLAIVMIERPDGERDFFEGVNTEVAPQSGSICAERTAISSARVKYPEMRRSWVKAAAAVYLPENANFKAGATAVDKNPCWPCSLCIEWLRKMGKYPGSVRVFAYNTVKMNQVVLERFVKLSVEIQVSPTDVEACFKCGTIMQKKHPSTGIHGCPFCKLPGDTPVQASATVVEINGSSAVLTHIK